MKIISLAAMRKYAPRWGENTISETGLERALEACSRDPMFYQVKRRRALWRQNDAMQKCARRWGESTISENCLPRASEPCSENLIFCKENQRFRVCLAVRGSRTKTPPQSRPGAPRAHLKENDSPRTPKSCSKNLVFLKENRKFHVFLHEEMSSCNAKPRWGESTISE